ncbi:MAG TPA: alkaline phosphatase family protein, partial [Gemmatimonadaceae bacterium]|nr:alkaline phosphatase family protein [Gemmatimonadaceae bacterium]
MRDEAAPVLLRHLPVLRPEVRQEPGRLVLAGRVSSGKSPGPRSRHALCARLGHARPDGCAWDSIATPSGSLTPQPIRILRRLLLLLLLTLASACVRPLARTREPARKAVFIILDGIPADVIERVHTPVLDEIAAAGGYARAHVGGELGGRSQTPTISAPGYMSLLTATWAYKHNVWDNSRQSPNYDYWNLFRIVE